jgi:hypothetical protein
MVALMIERERGVCVVVGQPLLLLVASICDNNWAR